MFHVSPVTCHLITTLRSFTCYESLRRFGDATAGGMVIYKKRFLVNKFKEYSLQPEISIPLY